MKIVSLVSLIEKELLMRIIDLKVESPHLQATCRDHCTAPFSLLCMAKGVFSPVPPFSCYFVFEHYCRFVVNGFDIVFVFNLALCYINYPLKIILSSNLVNTFIDLFRHLYMSPDCSVSHMKILYKM